jgi:hypothetical protein
MKALLYGLTETLRPVNASKAERGVATIRKPGSRRSLVLFLKKEQPSLPVTGT